MTEGGRPVSSRPVWSANSSRTTRAKQEMVLKKKKESGMGFSAPRNVFMGVCKRKKSPVMGFIDFP